MKKVWCAFLLLIVIALCGCTAEELLQSNPQSQPLPDEIVFCHMYWCAPNITLTFSDEHELVFTPDRDVPKVVPLTDEEYAELEQLFSEIHDFSNLLFTDAEPDYIMRWGEMEQSGIGMFSTQIELEQFLSKLRSYYFGTEYDWRVEQERGYVRYNERMLPSAYKDMQNWAENECFREITDLSPIDDLDAVEALDGNVYHYYGTYGIDYIQQDGDRYYACYRSEDELLTVWFDRQGTKVGTERTPFEV